MILIIILLYLSQLGTCADYVCQGINFKNKEQNFKQQFFMGDSYKNEQEECFKKTNCCWITILYNVNTHTTLCQSPSTYKDKEDFCQTHLNDLRLYALQYWSIDNIYEVINCDCGTFSDWVYVGFAIVGLVVLFILICIYKECKKKIIGHQMNQFQQQNQGLDLKKYQYDSEDDDENEQQGNDQQDIDDDQIEDSKQKKGYFY